MPRGLPSLGLQMSPSFDGSGPRHGASIPAPFGEDDPIGRQVEVESELVDLGCR